MKKQQRPLPSTRELEEELQRVQHKRRYHWALRSTVYMLVTVAAAAVLVAVLWLPVLRIYGTSMAPTLTDGELVVTVKNHRADNGSLLAFYYNNKILVKRVIAQSGDWITMDPEGNVYVNDVLLEEPYLTEKAYGDTNIEFPFQVPDGRVFVMGDHRATSVDSRNTVVGCVSQEQIVGQIVLRIWPPARIGAPG